MKKFILALAILGALLPASKSVATTDALTDIALVVRNIHDPDLFEVRNFTIFGCYGTDTGPLLAQFTEEYKIPSNIGCGGQRFFDNINYLTCAKISKSVANEKIYTGLDLIELDISKCDAKTNENFIAAVRLAVIRNFVPYNLVKGKKVAAGTVQLVLKK